MFGDSSGSISPEVMKSFISLVKGGIVSENANGSQTVSFLDAGFEVTTDVE